MMILLPSLNRPALLKRFFESYEATKASCRGLVLVDHADMEKNLEEYDKMALPDGWRLVDTGTAISMGDKTRFIWNEVKNEATIGLLNDDHFCVTEAWDKKVDALLNGTNMVSTNDGNWNFGFRVTGLTAWSMPLLEAAGFPIFPRNLQHLCIDDVWKAIGESTGCWLETNKIDIHHKHAFKNEMEKDSTFLKVYAQPSWEYDAREFRHFMEQDFKGVCERIGQLRMTINKKEKFV